ncbi:bis(5'-nucleosyl)-tetraphosphatase PrpE [Bacillus carboniphilus]|uniref:Bis(5'-nucleosyl)-tetraphosphatase PrpE n=1 Tax=Bacillus carboniphilus TaxID=86663 RepID=A0ABY9JWS7_9BACI|nr:bis(5'-nucleosyl)-tetraphosphatase PrpE [Bacillus carboniphilus]WLR42958.1 bis(5'-nucleosyl)-tetraphosphatase PrpE [Bacillus carboniphilus]
MVKVDIIGDIHGCYEEFSLLTKQMGYTWDRIPIHPDGRKLAFVGDLTDRGPNSIKVIEVVTELVKRELAFYAPGNHCNKLYRFFLGNPVQQKHGLETTVAEFNELKPIRQEHIKESFIQLYEESSLYHILDHENLVITHAGILEKDIGKKNKHIETFVLYGDITGQILESGRPERRDWAVNYQGKPMIVYGHTPVLEPRVMNNTYNIDTGVVFGNKLTAFRYPEKKFMFQKAISMPYDPTRFS